MFSPALRYDLVQGLLSVDPRWPLKLPPVCLHRMLRVWSPHGLRLLLGSSRLPVSSLVSFLLPCAAMAAALAVRLEQVLSALPENANPLTATRQLLWSTLDRQLPDSFFTQLRVAAALLGL